ncbi:hypothetical protein [Archaeoglobus veneficus]|uniref:Uncharacterized protein n=2 Tax=root TaxID=1 RepID=F2KMF1_ARCVS|nr:hypothetical protein [Archaeoglobus veneficus]AEA46050.1 hypothetical protein Arcve_0006 [Archaeoglobus veneficus SNP6]
MRVVEGVECVFVEQKHKYKVFGKPRISQQVGEYIQFDVITPQGGIVPVVMTLKQARKLAKEIQEYIEQKKELEEASALKAFRELFSNSEVIE